MRIQRVLANNPGPFTGSGTNTWLLDDGDGQLVVIDPGPIDVEHFRSIESAIGNRTVTNVLVTHTHPDHAPLANPLADQLDVPALGFAPGPDFDPDELLGDGSVVRAGEVTLEVVHTPGHADDHLCFKVGNVLFSGDHIIGGSSVMVESMGPYLQSLERLRGMGLERIYPGHGEEMGDPDQVIDWYVAHRRQRHEEVYAAIAGGADTVDSVVEAVYADVDRSLHPLATRSVAAHLGLLRDEGRIAFEANTIVPLPPQSQ